VSVQFALGNEQASGAFISDCGRYRYELFRVWDKRPQATFVMLNPSTADYRVDDPTIRKCIGFAKRWECGGVRVLNLFAIRSTDPRELHRSTVDIVGEANDRTLQHAFELAKAFEPAPAIVGWGAFKHPRVEERAIQVAGMAAHAEIELKCLGRAQDGSPRHPLMLPYSTSLEVWP
jgi:hypothetical protein